MRSRGEQGTCTARQFPEFAVTTCVPFWTCPGPKSAPQHAGLQGWPLAGIWEPGFRGTFPPFPNWWGSLCAQAVRTNHVAYAEHLLSFWVLVCAWRSTHMTSPHRNRGCRPLRPSWWTTPHTYSHNLVLRNHKCLAWPNGETTPEAHSWFPLDFAPCAFSLCWFCCSKS